MKISRRYIQDLIREELENIHKKMPRRSGGEFNTVLKINKKSNAVIINGEETFVDEVRNQLQQQASDAIGGVAPYMPDNLSDVLYNRIQDSLSAGEINIEITYTDSLGWIF